MVRLLPNLIGSFGFYKHEFQSQQWCDCCPLCQSGVRGGKFQSHNGAIAAIASLLQEACKPLFQSHNGAIAAEGGRLSLCHHAEVSIPQWCDCCKVKGGLCVLKRVSFNPTMVRLLLQDFLHNGLTLKLFQSHNGAIAAFKASKSPSALAAFQSHNGAIAAASVQLTTVENNKVSIPQWCDCCRKNDEGRKEVSRGFNPTMVRLLRF